MLKAFRRKKLKCGRELLEHNLRSEYNFKVSDQDICVRGGRGDLKIALILLLSLTN
jgi:hypothetical protein